MRTITVAELRQNPTAALAEVESGVTYVVTRHRRPIAQLTPLTHASPEVTPAPRRSAVRLADRVGEQRRSMAELETLLDEVKGDW